MEAMDAKYRPVMFPNGTLKKLKPAPAVAAVAGEPVYRECLKNHAATLGGHAVDGCGEFMPSPAANPADPTSLKCAACGCHRNFHRRLPEASPSPPPPPPALPMPMPVAPAPHLLQAALHPHRDEPPEERQPPQPAAAAADDDDSDSEDDDSEDEDDDRSPSPPPSAAGAAGPQPPLYFSSAPHMLLALSSGGPAAATRPPAPPTCSPAPPPPATAAARKRFRTKFSPEQKQRMQELSERLGWRLQKRDEAIVDEWCREIGVGKGVFKVWMHNNKHNFLGGHSARRSAAAAALHHHHLPGDSPQPPPPASSAAAAQPANAHPADFNINGAAAAAAATAADDQNGSSPQSS